MATKGFWVRAEFQMSVRKVRKQEGYRGDGGAGAGGREDTPVRKYY